MLTRKKYSHLVNRKVAFFHWASQTLIGDGVKEQFCHRDLPNLLTVLLEAKIDFCYLVCSKTDLPRDWFFSWVGTTNSYNHEYRSGSYSAYGRDVQIKHAGMWFDLPQGITSRECYGAWLRVRHWLANRSSNQIPAMSTPSQSGLRLLEISLPANHQFEVPDSEIVQMIRAHTPQARKEIFPPRTLESLNGAFYYYDARWAYAACASIELPGELQIAAVNVDKDYGDVFADSYWQGWCEVDFSVPATWHHVGLLPVKTATGFVWPVSGTWNNVIVTGREARLAASHGWLLTVRKLWKFSTVRPLRTWAEKLIELRGLEKSELYKSAIRNVMLHSIGAMYSDSFAREIGLSRDDFAERAGELTKEQRLSAVRVGGEVRMKDRVMKEGGQAKYYMPHWVSQIWAECRNRLAVQMLCMPFDDLIACNLDAIYTRRRAGIVDDGRIGRFRLKGELDGQELSGFLETDLYGKTALGWNELEAIKVFSEGYQAQYGKAVLV